MKFRCRIIVAWCALGVAPSSFGAWEDEAVATVDGAGPVTAGDLAYFYGRAAEGGGAVDLKDLLDNVLTGEIMTIEAEAAGYGNDAGVVAALAAWRSKALADYAWGEIAQDVVVPEEEVQAFYEKQEKRRTYSFIKSDDRERAAKAFRALKAGEPWDKVVARYSDFKGYSGPGGAWEVPMEYDGTAAAEGLFALRPGEYTAPIPDAAGLAWYIYRYGKTVHGSGLTFEGAQAGITAYMRDRKVERRFRELTAAWRDEAPVRRNDVLWKEVRAVPVGKLRARHFGRGETLSDAGGVAVPFDDVYAAVEKHLGPLPEMEKYRKKEPAPYVRVWEYYLRDAEDRALLEWRALQEGADEGRGPARPHGRAQQDQLGAREVELALGVADLGLPAPRREAEAAEVARLAAVGDGDEAHGVLPRAELLRQEVGQGLGVPGPGVIGDHYLHPLLPPSRARSEAISPSGVEKLAHRARPEDARSPPHWPRRGPTGAGDPRGRSAASRPGGGPMPKA